MSDIDIDFSGLSESIAMDLDRDIFSNENHNFYTNYINSSDFEDILKFSLSTNNSAEAAASKFIDVLFYELKHHIGSNYSIGEISEEAFDFLDYNLSQCFIYTDPYVLYDGEISIIVINLAEEDRSIFRKDSLAPDRYPGGAYNIYTLLDRGYSASNSVYGYWNGKKTKSLKNREGANFFEGAIDDFMGNYAYEYGVVSVKPID